jgi:septum site-determining protein MinC
MALTPSRPSPDVDSAVTLRGTQRGLEVEIHPGTDSPEIVAGLRLKLLESPGFWAGSNVILRFLGEVVPGSLGPLERVCTEFDLSIVGIRSPLEERNKAARAALAVVNELAEGSGPMDNTTGPIKVPRLVQVEPATGIGQSRITGNKQRATGNRQWEVAATEPPVEVEPAPAPAPEPALEPALEPAPAPEPPANLAKFVRGPIRSGVILESDRHLIVLGDVNPGAEVRSLGSITVLGRMRGVAHAGAGTADGAGGFILALELAPQQLRLGELVARAGDAETPPGHAEIAFARQEQIIVETFRGSLPRQLWSLLAE